MGTSSNGEAKKYTREKGGKKRQFPLYERCFVKVTESKVVLSNLSTFPPFYLKHFTQQVFLCVIEFYFLSLCLPVTTTFDIYTLLLLCLLTRLAY